MEPYLVCAAVRALRPCIFLPSHYNIPSAWHVNPWTRNSLLYWSGHLIRKWSCFICHHSPLSHCTHFFVNVFYLRKISLLPSRVGAWSARHLDIRIQHYRCMLLRFTWHYIMGVKSQIWHLVQRKTRARAGVTPAIHKAATNQPSTLMRAPAANEIIYSARGSHEFSSYFLIISSPKP